MVGTTIRNTVAASRSADGSLVPAMLADGASGWTPILAGEADGTRTLIKVIDWVGGGTTKPSVNLYIGTTGYVASKAQAFNFNALKRVMSMTAVTNSAGVATFNLSAITPGLTDTPQIVVTSLYTNVIGVQCRPKSQTASKTTATVTVEQVGVVGGVVALAVGATVTILVIEA